MNASHTAISPHHTAPHGNDDVVARLQTSEIFRDYQDAFETATGLPLVFRAAGSFQAPLAGSKQIASFCALMGGTSKTCAACLQLQAQLEGEALHEPKTVRCLAGLNESVVPVRIGEKIIGYLQTGQVLFQPPTKKGFRAAMAEVEKLKSTVDVAQLEAAYFETRVLTRVRYAAVLRLLGCFAQQLSSLSNELMLRSAATEPPAVAKARAFVAEHLGEELSLDLVAHAAHMSAFYFCKVFKAATGVTLTDYIARARIEKTKHLLLNPHVRISEAAFEAGFQSLSQFNRVFRRVVGESPTTYREHLHGSIASGATHSPLAFAA